MSFWPASWEDVNNLAQSVALVVGGWWALKRFGLTRESRTFLDLSASARVVDGSADSMLVVVTVQMKNIGSARIDPKTTRNPDGSIFNDGYDHCLHAATLKVRRIPDYQAPTQFDWYVLPPMSADIRTLNRHVHEPLEEINYIADFNEVHEDGSVEPDFWLEPNTSYDASVTLRLAKGTYAIKTFFIGALDSPREQEYWSHMTVFHCDVPASPP
jgi:hypothetical protein